MGEIYNHYLQQLKNIRMAIKGRSIDIAEIKKIKDIDNRIVKELNNLKEMERPGNKQSYMIKSTANTITRLINLKREAINDLANIEVAEIRFFKE